MENLFHFRVRRAESGELQRVVNQKHGAHAAVRGNQLNQLAEAHIAQIARLFDDEVAACRLLRGIADAVDIEALCLYLGRGTLETGHGLRLLEAFHRPLQSFFRSSSLNQCVERARRPEQFRLLRSGLCGRCLFRKRLFRGAHGALCRRCRCVLFRRRRFGHGVDCRLRFTCRRFRCLFRGLRIGLLCDLFRGGSRKLRRFDGSRGLRTLARLDRRLFIDSRGLFGLPGGFLNQLCLFVLLEAAQFCFFPRELFPSLLAGEFRQHFGLIELRLAGSQFLFNLTGARRRPRSGCRALFLIAESVHHELLGARKFGIGRALLGRHHILARRTGTLLAIALFYRTRIRNRRALRHCRTV